MRQGATLVADAYTSVPSRRDSTIDGVRLRLLIGPQKCVLELRSQDAMYACALFVVGGNASVRVNGSDTVLESREFLVLSPHFSHGIAVGMGSVAILLHLPDTSVGAHFAAFRMAEGRVINTSSGLASIVGHLLDGFAGPQDPEVSASNLLAQHIVGLLALMVRENLADVDLRPGTLIAAMEFIEDNLNDKKLSPDFIARAQNVSTRTLHRLFEAENLTIAGWIRAVRLEACRSELVNPDLRELTVSMIGVRAGLTDAAHFSRLFRGAYGLAPRDYRSLHLGHSCVDECRTPNQQATERRSRSITSR